MPWRGALIERGAEIDALDAALARAVRTGAVVVIEGPAGIGKSRLLDVIRERATDYEVLSARGGALEQVIAFGVVRQLLERRVARASEEEQRELLSGAAAGAATVLGIGGEDPERSASEQARSLHGLYWLVANLAEQRPLVIAVDDLHWADKASVEFLVYLAHRIEGLPILVITAVRSGESSLHEPPIAELTARAAVIRPAPLSEQGVDQLVKSALGASASPRLVHACREATGGNPFYLGELLASIVPPGGDPAAISLDTVRQTLPSTVARSILLRLGRLPDPAPRLARSAAVLGDGAPLRHAAALSGVKPEKAAAAADALLKASILAEVHPLRFAHPIVDSAIANDWPPAQRAEAHRQAALLLRSEGEPDERIALHLMRSPPAGEEWAVESLQAAARDAMARGVPDVAARLLSRAIEETPSALHVDLLLRLAVAQLASGAYAESAVTAQRAIEAAPDPTTRASIRLAQSYALVSVEGPAAAMRCLEDGIKEIGLSNPQLSFALEGELAMQASLMDVPHPALRMLDRYRELPGTTRAECAVLAILALQAVGEDEPASTVRDLAARALTDDLLLMDDTGARLPFYAAVAALLFAGAYDEARKAIALGMEDTLKRGTSFGFAGMAWARGLLATCEGDLASAEADERACVEHAVPTMVGIGVAALAMVLTERGDAAAAFKELDRAGLLGNDRPLYLFGPYTRGLVFMALGRPKEALADFLDVGRHATEVGGFAAGYPWQAQAALAMHALGDQAGAEQAAAEQLARAERRGVREYHGVALRVCGLVSSGDERVKRLADAVDLLETSRAKLELARARFDLGVASLRAGKRAHGRDQLEKSYDAAVVCGARGLAQAAFDELKVAGARPRRLMFSGADSLTASERRVAHMAADGLTNREIAQALFLTPKTVENQLGRAYAKLGVNSRRALRDALL